MIRKMIPVSYYYLYGRDFSMLLSKARGYSSLAVTLIHFNTYYKANMYSIVNTILHLLVYPLLASFGISSYISIRPKPNSNVSRYLHLQQG